MSENLKNRATQIRNEKGEAKNTSDRVGSWMEDAVKELDTKASKDELANATTNNKGIFSTLIALQTAYPKASNKKAWFAFVGTENPRNKYLVKAESGDWIDTTELHNVADVDLDGYTQNGGSSKTAQELDKDIQATIAYLPHKGTVPLVWQQGGIPDPSDTRINTDYVRLNSNIDKVNIPDGARFWILQFDVTYTQLEFSTYTESTKDIKLLDNTEFVRFVFGFQDNIKVTPKDGKLLEVYLGELNLGVWKQGGIPTSEPPQLYRIHTDKKAVNGNSLNLMLADGYSVAILEFDKSSKQTTYKSVLFSTYDHPLEPTTSYIQVVLYLTRGGNVTPNDGKSVVIKQNVSGEFDRAISKTEFEMRMADFSIPTAIDKHDILQHRNYEIVDYSSSFPKKYLTTGTRDRSFPIAIGKGNKMILSYINRESHNDPNYKMVMRKSVDYGKTFGNEILLNGYALTTGVRIKGTNRIVAVSIIANDGTGQGSKSYPVICDFDELFDSSGVSGWKVGEQFVVPSDPTGYLSLSSTFAIHKGVLYLSGTYKQGDTQNSAVFKSNDLGDTWEFVSIAPTCGIGECAITFDDNERLLLLSRHQDGENFDTGNNYLHFSDDFGITWEAVKLKDINMHNPYIFLWKDYPICAGRLRMENNRFASILGFVVLNKDYSVRCVTSFDNSIQRLSYHQGYTKVGEMLKIFSHKYAQNMSESNIFTFDLPLNLLDTIVDSNKMF